MLIFTNLHEPDQCSSATEGKSIPKRLMNSDFWDVKAKINPKKLTMVSANLGEVSPTEGDLLSLNWNKYWTKYFIVFLIYSVNSNEHLTSYLEEVTILTPKRDINNGYDYKEQAKDESGKI